MVHPLLCALAEPTRLVALRLLADENEHCVRELMQVLDATQSRMSRHMQTLKQAGLVIERRDAQRVRYRLKPDLPQNTTRSLEAVLEMETDTERAAA